MSVRSVVATWIVATASGDTDLVNEVSSNVYDTLAPQVETKADDPDEYIIFIPPRSLRNVMAMGARIIQAASDGWVIKVVGANKEFSELETGAARIRALFHRGGALDSEPAPFPISVTGGEIIECYETDILSYEEDDAGVTYRHLGGLYHIAARTV